MQNQHSVTTLTLACHERREVSFVFKLVKRRLSKISQHLVWAVGIRWCYTQTSEHGSRTGSFALYKDLEMYLKIWWTVATHKLANAFSFL